MDHVKEALKKKMGKAIEIHIHVGKDTHEEDKKTDMAPEVKDSDEPGVITSNHPDQTQDMALMNDVMGQSNQPQMPNNRDYANALISHAPAHPAGGKTLDSIARERAMKRRDAKKG